MAKEKFGRRTKAFRNHFVIGPDLLQNIFLIRLTKFAKDRGFDEQRPPQNVRSGFQRKKVNNSEIKNYYFACIF